MRRDAHAVWPGARDRTRATLEGVVAGGGACALIGAAGLGKTTLLGRVVRDAATHQVAVAAARAYDLDATTPFALTRRLLRPVWDADAAPRSGLAGHAAPLFERDATSLAGLPATEAQDLLRRGVVALLEQSARPIALVADDLHRSDPESLATLHAIAAAELPNVRVVCATRPVERVPQTRALRRLLGAPQLTVTTLDPLDDAEADAILDAFGVPLDAAQRALARGLGAGNPLLLQEVVRALASGGEGARPHISDDGPARIRRVIGGRLAALDAEAAGLLDAVAVRGGDVPLSEAAALAGLTPHGAGVAAQELSTLALLEPRTPLRVSHPMVAEAALDAIGPERRTALHVRAAALLADVDPEAAAAHLLAAPGEAESASALPVLGAAAAAARRRAAPDAAARYYRAAVGSRLDQADPTLVQALAEAEVASGSDAALESVRAACRAIADPAARARAALDHGIGLVNAGRSDLAADVLDRGLVAARAGGDARTTRMLHAARAVTGGIGGDLHELGGLDGVLRAIADGNASSAERMIVAHEAFGVAMRGDGAARAIELARAATTGVDVPIGDVVAVGAATLGAMALLIADELTEAAEVLDPVVERAAARSARISFAAVAHVRAHVRLRAGQVAAAQQDALAVIDAMRPGWTIAQPSIHAALALSRTIAGDRAGAEEALSLDADEERFAGDFTWADYLEARALHAYTGGDHERALRDSLACEARMRGAGTDHDGVVPWRAVAIAAALRCDEDALAARIAGEGLEQARAFGAPLVLAGALAGQALVGGGRSALALLDEAAALATPPHAVLARVRIAATRATVLAALGSTSDARDAARTAAAEAAGCGAHGYEAAALAQLVELGGRPRRRASHGPDALTEREARVARLLAEGASNPEIAATLVISRKTVEGHVGHVLRKLGVASRDEVGDALRASG